MFLEQVQLTNEIIPIRFEAPMQKIYCISTAYNNTLVILKENLNRISLMHLDLNGKILFEHFYKDYFKLFRMMTDREVLLPNKSDKKIQIVCLESKTVRHVNHQYLKSIFIEYNIYTFSQTQLFCILENPKIEPIKLTYYRYGGIKKSSLLETVKIIENVRPDLSFSKMNDHSKIGWWNGVEKKSRITFTVFDLTDSPKGMQSNICLKNSHDFNNKILNICNIWEIQPNIYLLVAYTWSNWKDAQLSKYEKCIYRVDVCAKTNASKIKKFEFDHQAMFLSSFFRLGQFSVFRFKRQNISLVYIVRNKTEQIVHRSTEMPYNFEFYFQDWDEFTTIQWCYLFKNTQISLIKKKISKKLDCKTVLLDMLLALNEDFDDDLLQDAVQIITEKS